MQAVSCPHCSATMSVPDVMVGNELHCARCGQAFQSVAPAPALAETGERPDESSQASAGPSKVESQGPLAPIEHWRKIRLGITCMWASVIITIGIVLLLCASSGIVIAAAADRRSASLEQLQVAVLVVVGIALAASLLIILLQVAAMVLSLWAPRKHGARLLAWLALLFTLGGFVFSGVVSVVEENPAPWRASPVLRGAAGGRDSVADFGIIPNAIGLVIYLFHLRAVARNLQDPDLIQTTRWPLILLGVTVAWVGGILGIGMLFVAGGRKEPPEAIPALGGCGLWIFGPAFIIALLITLSSLRKALGRNAVGKT